MNVKKKKGRVTDLRKKAWEIIALSEEESRRYHDPFGQYSRVRRSGNAGDFEDGNYDDPPPCDYHKIVYEMYDDVGNLVGQTVDKRSLERIREVHLNGTGEYEWFMNRYGYGRRR